MEYGAIAGVGIPVSRLILGTMAYTAEPEDQYQLWRTMLDTFSEAGGNAFDTANVYGNGSSERTLGRWLAESGNRGRVVLVGKGAHPRPGQPRRVNPEAIDTDLTESLARLKTSYIDLFLLHRDDTSVSVGPILEGLNRHLDAGRIHAIGGSNWTTERLDEANSYAAAHGLRGFAASSPNLSLAAPVEPLWPGCVSVAGNDLAWYRRRDVPLLSWSSQARGFFSGRFSPERRDDATVARVYYTEANWERLRRAQALGQQRATSATRVALAWVLRQRAPVFALIGPLALEELRDSLAALDVALSPSEVAWLNLEREVPDA